MKWISFQMIVCSVHHPFLFRTMKEEKEKKKKKKNEKITEQDQSEKAENTDPQPSTSAQPDETGSKKKKKKKNKFKIQHDEVSSTTVDPSSELLKSYQTRKYLLVKAGGEALDNQVTDLAKLFKVCMPSMSTSAG